MLASASRAIAATSSSANPSALYPMFSTARSMPWSRQVSASQAACSTNASRWRSSWTPTVPWTTPTSASSVAAFATARSWYSRIPASTWGTAVAKSGKCGRWTVQSRPASSSFARKSAASNASTGQSRELSAGSTKSTSPVFPSTKSRLGPMVVPSFIATTLSTWCQKVFSDRGRSAATRHRARLRQWSNGTATCLIPSNHYEISMTDERAVGADAFAELGPAVRSALSERGFATPTEPQRRAIPPLAAGKDALVIAPTGTGKTETAMLPVFDAIAAADPRFGISALYVTPLRALNRDMRQRLDWWGEELDLDIDVRHGDTTDYQRQKQANDPPDVLVTTPETLQAMLTGSKLRTALEDVHHVVVDEVHELASAKRGAQLTIGLERLAELAGDFQRIGLSATVGDPGEVGRFLTGGEDCEIVEVDVGSKVEFEVREPEITDADERLAGELATDESVASHVRAILEVVEDHDSTLIFVNTRQTAEALGSRFKQLNANVGVHHGSLSKEARIDVEDRFKAGELDALLCTSSMELGIDVGRIDHVVQYSSPREVARLLQRVGRAGHRSDEVSYGTIVTKHPDDTLEALAIARRAKDGEVENAEIHDGSLDTVANQIVGLVMDFGELSAMRAYDIVTKAYPFRDLTEEAFKAVVRELKSNRLVWLDEEADQLEKSSQTWQYIYANLSMIPDEQKYTVEDIASGSQIGTLDERFVVNFAQPGEIFVQRGEMWRITEVDDDEETVKVSPIEDPGGEIPSWVSQEIPVPREVAQEVGEMRAVAGSQFERGAPREGVAREFTNRYPTDEYTASEALSQLDRHAETEAPLPTADRIVVEHAACVV